MAEWHLKELHDELGRHGWHLAAELPGNEYDISATWEVVRYSYVSSVFIDFDGLDDVVTLPIEKSYGCRVRGSAGHSLYFSRKGTGGSVRKNDWHSRLRDFVSQLDQHTGDGQQPAH